MTPALGARHLAYRTGGALLVTDVDLDIAAGELVAVIGPNGAGKSTLVRLVAGDLTPTRGTVTIGGTADDDDARLALRRAVLPQQRVSDVPFTAWEVVAMGRHPHRRDPANSAAADHAAIAEAMDRTDTTRFARRVYATLSGGEQTRVSLARVFAQDTPLLILDEPTGALDVAHEEQVMRELALLARRGTAILAVLHDLNLAARHATRIVAMSGGSIAADGMPAEVLTDDLLTRIYGHPMHVVPHPFRECLLVLASDVEASPA